MSLSTRVSMQWHGQPAGEPTSTMVVVSPGNHFVDIRINKDKYPSDKDGKYHEIFQWSMTGTEHAIEGTNKVEFKSEINNFAVWEAIETGKSVEEIPTSTDIGAFSSIPGSEDRRETGSMVNPETGKMTDYIEIWRSLDPLRHSPDVEVREPKSKESTVSYVLIVSSPNYEGKLVRLGNWTQAILYDKQNKEFPLNVNRSYYGGQWQSLISYGTLGFPLDFSGSVDDTVTVDRIEWTCIEAHN